MTLYELCIDTALEIEYRRRRGLPNLDIHLRTAAPVSFPEGFIKILFPEDILWLWAKVRGRKTGLVPDLTIWPKSISKEE